MIVDVIVNKKDEVLGDNDLNLKNSGSSLNDWIFNNTEIKNVKEEKEKVDLQQLEKEKLEKFILEEQNNIKLMDVKNSKAGGNVKKEIIEWEEGDSNKLNSNKRVSFDNILKINSSDVDKHFEKIKEVTTLAIKKAEEKALSIKQKVEDRMDDEDIENPSVVKKFKSIANKIKGLKKK